MDESAGVQPEQGKTEDDGPGQYIAWHAPASEVIQNEAEHQCMQVPVGTDGVEEELVEQDARRKFGYPLAHGQQVGGHGITQLHTGVRDEYPQYLAPAFPQVFHRLGQVAGDEQEARHMEGIDYLFGVGIAVAYVHQVEGHHQQDEDTLQIVDFRNALQGHFE